MSTDDRSPGEGHDLSSYDQLGDSRPLRPPTLDERVRDLEARHDARQREGRELGKRLTAVEGWPSRVIVAIVGGALGMVLTVAGSAWSLSAELARTSAALDAITERLERVEDRLDRIEERTWQRVDTRTRTEE